MVYPTLATYNLSSGAEVMLCYVNDVTGELFVRMFLVAIFAICVAGSYLMMKRQQGVGDFPVSFVIGSWTTMISAFLMRIMDCPYNYLVSDITLAICIGMCIVSVIMLFWSKEY